MELRRFVKWPVIGPIIMENIALRETVVNQSEMLARAEKSRKEHFHNETQAVDALGRMEASYHAAMAEKQSMQSAYDALTRDTAEVNSTAQAISTANVDLSAKLEMALERIKVLVKSGEAGMNEPPIALKLPTKKAPAIKSARKKR